MGKTIAINDINKTNKEFEKLCRMTQKTLKKHLVKELQKLGKKEVISDKGYIYSKGTFPVLICAHMDTVHENTPKIITYTEGKISSPQGIGGDDRCGVYIILQILKKIDCHVAFFEDEESGGVGSDLFTVTDYCKQMDVKFVIEFDRMNQNDAVFYRCDNEEFEEFITKEFFETNYGSFTDICNICPVIGVAGVNISCGYYKQHTKEEYVVLKEMETVITEAIKLLERTDTSIKYEYIEAKYTYSSYGSYYGNYYFNKYIDNKYKTKTTSWYSTKEEWEVYFTLNGEEIIDYAYGSTLEEAFYDFMTAYPEVCYADIMYFEQVLNKEDRDKNGKIYDR